MIAMKEQRKLLNYLLSVLVIASRSNSRNVFKIVAVKNFYTKKESSWMEYKGKERIVRRDSGNDRVFPIDSQSLEKFYNATLMKVLGELGISSPLRYSGITKADVRRISHAMGIPVQQYTPAPTQTSLQGRCTH